MLLFVLLLVSTGLMYFYFMRSRMLEREIEKWRTGIKVRDGETAEAPKAEPAVSSTPRPATGAAIAPTATPAIQMNTAAATPRPTATPAVVVRATATPGSAEPPAGSILPGVESDPVGAIITRDQAGTAPGQPSAGTASPPATGRAVSTATPRPSDVLMGGASETAAPRRTPSGPINSIYDIQPGADRGTPRRTDTPTPEADPVGEILRTNP